MNSSSSAATMRIGDFFPLPSRTAARSPEAIRLRTVSSLRRSLRAASVTVRSVSGSRNIYRCGSFYRAKWIDRKQASYPEGVAAIATELEATGWVPADETGRYLRHPMRFGEAVFDRSDVEQMERRGRRATPAPRRAPPCTCSLSSGRLEERICWKCGKRVS